MIVYFVRYQTFEAPTHTVTVEPSPLDTWLAAKKRRNDHHFSNGNVRRCWVERVERVKDQDGNAFVEFSKERWGAVLERRKEEAVS